MDGRPNFVEINSTYRVDHVLRRRNKRYKNYQLVSQHCCVASFGRCFAFFTLQDQFVAQKKNRVAG